MASASCTVPTLHQLADGCLATCAIIDLQNAPDLLEVAQEFHAAVLRERVMSFMKACWGAIQDTHPTDRLKPLLGDELFAALAEERADTERRVRRLSQLGEVVEKPAAPSTVPAVRTTSGRDTYPYEQVRCGIEHCCVLRAPAHLCCSFRLWRRTASNERRLATRSGSRGQREVPVR